MKINLYAVIILLLLFACTKNDETKKEEATTNTSENNLTYRERLQAKTKKQEAVLGAANQKTPQTPQINEKQNNTNIALTAEIVSDKFNRLNIKSKEDFLTEEEIALMSDEQIKDYIAMLLNQEKVPSRTIIDSMMHIFTGALSNHIDSGYLYGLCVCFESVSGMGTHDNFDNYNFLLKNILQHVMNKNDNTLEHFYCYKLLDVFSVAFSNPYKFNTILSELTEISKGHSDLTQNISFQYYKTVAKKTAEKEEDYQKAYHIMENFLKTAEPQYAHHPEALEILARHKTLNSIIAANYDDNELKDLINKWGMRRLSIFPAQQYIRYAIDDYNSINDINPEQQKLKEFYEIYYEEFMANLEQIKEQYNPLNIKQINEKN